MKTEHDDLIDTYHVMSTEELLDHWESGTLTDLATKIAAEELTRRGVALPQVERVDDDADSESEEQTEFETIERSFTPTEMHILRGRLEADGIQAFVVDDNINQTNSLLAVAVGGVRLQVAKQHAEEARRIIDEVKLGQRDLGNEPMEETIVDDARDIRDTHDAPPVKAITPSANPAPYWEFMLTTLIFCFASFEFVKTVWFAHTYNADINWDAVAVFAVLLPSLYFVGALLLVLRSKWAILCFGTHLPLAIGSAFFLTLVEPFDVAQLTSWISTAMVIYYCMHLRRKGRLA
jgi:hypothetical protein